MKLPAIQFYPGDWLQDPVAGCSLAAQGLWLRLLFLMHNSPRYGYLTCDRRPASLDWICRQVGTSQETLTALLAELDAAHVPSRTNEGTIFSRRLVRDDKKRRQERLRKAEQRQREANQPESSQNDNHLSNQQECHAFVPPVVPPMSRRSSSSSSSSEEEVFEKHTGSSAEFVERAVCLQNGESGDLFATWIGAFLAAGVKLSDRDRDKAARGTANIPGFFSFDEPEQRVIVEYTIAKARTTEPRYMGLPVNFLDRGEWRRKGGDRTLPPPRKTSRSEQATEDAARSYLTRKYGGDQTNRQGHGNS